KVMDLTALLLSRLHFAFTISFHIIFPSFTIGLAAWLTVLEALHLATGRPVYRVIFEFWLKIFGVAFGFGVVSGVVMAFEMGTNWSEFSRRSGPIQGVLLSYETFTAFCLEAGFFGILLFGRARVPPWFYLSPPRWSRSGRRSRPSGSCSITAGCRRPSVMWSRTGNSYPMIGPRSSSVRWSGCVFPTCFWRPT